MTLEVTDGQEGPTTTPEQAAAELMAGTASTPSSRENAAPREVVEVDDDSVVGTSSLADLAKKAAELEAEPESEADPKKGEAKVEEPPAPQPKKETTESAAVKTRDARLQKIIDTKFGGDEEAFVASLYEQQNSAAALHREMKELKQQLETKKETPPTADDHPDLGWIAQELSSLKAESTTNEAEQNRLLAEGRELNAEILRKEGELKRADELDQREIKRDIAEIKGQINQKALLFKSLDARNRAISGEERKLLRQKETVEREVLSEREQLREKESESEANEAKEYAKFQTAVDAVAKEYGIEDKDVYDDMYETVRARAALHIRVNGPVEDLAVLTRALGEKYASIHKLQKKAEFAQMSSEKAQTARPSAATPKAPAEPTTDKTPRATEKKWSPDFVRMRAAKLLP